MRGAIAANPILRRNLITIAAMMATIMQTLDSTIANVALPHMQGAMSATQDQIAWVLTSYIVASAIMTPPTGVLAQRFGRKRLFLIYIVGFVVTSMLCGAAQTLPEIVFFRLLQGAFGAGFIPLSQALMLDIYPREKYGAAMAIWSGGLMIGPILGPTLGGYLTDMYSWRWVFYINLPFGILAFLGISSFLSETEKTSRRFDIFGFLVLSLSIGALQMMLDRGQSQDWFASPEILIECALALLFLYLFVVQIFTTREPFLEPSLFRDRNFTVGMVLTFFIGGAMLATYVLLPPYLQNLMGVPVRTTGWILAPRGLGMMIAMLMISRLIARYDPRALFLFGLSLNVVSFWIMSNFTPDVSLNTIAWSGLIQGFGLGFVFVPLSTMSFSTLSDHLRGEGTSIYNLIRNIGSSIGISVVMAIFAKNMQVNHAEIATSLTPFNAALNSPDAPAIWNWRLPEGALALNAEVTRQAAIISYANDFLLMMWVTILIAPLLLLLDKPTQPTT